MNKIEFTPTVAFGPMPYTYFGNRLDVYLAMPMIGWLNNHIGKLHWPREPNTVVTGDGWQIATVYTEELVSYVIFDEPIDSKLAVEFALRFQ